MQFGKVVLLSKYTIIDNLLWFDGKNLTFLQKSWSRFRVIFHTVLAKQLVLRNFCGKIMATKFRQSHISRNIERNTLWKSQQAVWKFREFTLTVFWQKFRESNGFNHTVWKMTLKRDHDFWKKVIFFPSNHSKLSIMVYLLSKTTFPNWK